ncbi:hypothetical protein TrVFT333_008611 [Trichoderma virens FT-333]|nr:hypothetical protein TrVFT333_008611 [Trichoderma virens FT-333]
MMRTWVTSSINVSLEKVIHGEGTNLHSFIGFHILLCGANHKRRFKVVTITIRFEDEGKPLKDDSEVVKIWPDTEYIWVSGEKVLLKRRAGSHKNGIRIRMWENPQEESGVLRELRTGVLIWRKRADPLRFKAYIEVKAAADMRYGVVQGLKKLVGAQHVTDPVAFEPGINCLDADDVAGINGGIPSAAMVRAYGEAASCVELTDVSKRVKKEDGEWRNVEQSDIRPTST